MERTEQLLREELRRGEDIPVPQRDAMLAGVARARRRRTAAVAGSALAVLGLVGAVVLTTTGWPGGTAPTGSALVTRLYSNALVNVVFTDPSHGYAVQEQCAEDEITDVPAGAPTPDVHQNCTTTMLGTDDGGKTWTQRTLPGDPATKDAGVEIAIGHSLMLWRSTPTTIAFGGWNRRYWTSSDGARTWTESPTPRPLPPGGGLAWFGAHDELAFLTTPPAGVYAGSGGSELWLGKQRDLVPATDGSFWIESGIEPSIQISRDHGATWVTRVPLATADSVDWVASYDGRTAYAGARDGQVSHLMRTDDGGVTWSEMTGIGGLPDRGFDGLVTPNGDLLIARPGEEGGIYRLSRGATTAERLADAPAYANAMYVTGGVVVVAPAYDQRSDPNVGSVAWYSADDGKTWKALPVQ